MLNTDLHNPNILASKKMTPEGFIKNCRGCNNGEDFPPEFLTELYEKIKSNPISLKEDEEKYIKKEKVVITAQKKADAFETVLKWLFLGIKRNFQPNLKYAGDKGRNKDKNTIRYCVRE